MKLSGLLLSFGVAIGGALLGHYMLATPPPHVAAGLDASASVMPNCAGVIAETKNLMAQASLQEGSTVTLLTIATSAINLEPTRAFDRPAPIPSDEIFGAKPGDFAAKQDAFFAAMQKACENASPAKTTPLYALVSRGVAHLRSRGCGPKSACVYLVKTDLEDEGDPALRAAIDRAAKTGAAQTPPSLTGSVDNAGIRIEVCGTSEVRPRRSSRHASPDALATIWRPIFTHPELVAFQPYCGQ